jgi:hypothetical protein
MKVLKTTVLAEEGRKKLVYKCESLLGNKHIQKYFKKSLK